LLAVLLAVVSVLLEVASDAKAHKHRRSFDRSDTVGITSYMRHWIESSGGAAIWTRDMSWVNDRVTEDLLLAKVRAGCLTLCLPKATPLASMLRDAGAEVFFYGEHDFQSPASRFTIAYSGNGGTRVAIGRADGSHHVIEELDASDPALHMADDLVALAKLLGRRKAQ